MDKADEFTAAVRANRRKILRTFHIPQFMVGPVDNWDWLRSSIRTMTRHSPIYKVLKEELSVLGYWKNKPRGESVRDSRESAREQADRVNDT